MSRIKMAYERDRIFKRITKTLETLKIILAKRFDENEQKTIIEDTLKEFELLIPEIPYIGDKENFFLGDFFDTILILALFRALSKEAVAERLVGELFYEMKEFV